jgi:hypothetical protein
MGGLCRAVVQALLKYFQAITGPKNIQWREVDF